MVPCRLRAVPGTRSTAYLWTLAIVSLLYLLLAVPGTQRAQSPVPAHETLEIVHLPRGFSGNDGDGARFGQDLRPSYLTTDHSDGSASGPGDRSPAALICALGLALLALFVPAESIPLVFRAAEAVLGVGRWHRTVVLLL
ncbi:MAG TPA: hypothetical protein VGC09_18860 [Rhodopila sp.]